MNIFNSNGSLTYEWAAIFGSFILVIAAMAFRYRYVRDKRRDEELRMKLEADLKATGAIDFLARVMHLEEIVRARVHSRATSGAVCVLVAGDYPAEEEAPQITSQEFDGVVCEEEIMACFDGARVTVFVLHVDTRDALLEAVEWLNDGGLYSFRGRRLPVDVQLVRQ